VTAGPGGHPVVTPVRPRPGGQDVRDAFEG
jgi:hypothetical protein